MTTTCKNCNTSFKGNFCYHCGQSASTHRLDLHSIWHDIQHGLLHIDKGLFYTISQLFTRPGHSIREYLEGKRVKHFKPISLVIILATVYVLINHYFHLDIIKESNNTISTDNSLLNLNINVTNGKEEPLAKAISDYVKSHFAIVQLMLLPFFAGATWLAFRKSGYNFIEHFVINAFIRGQAFIIKLILLPFLIAGILPAGINSNINTVIQLSFLIWAFIQIFSNHSRLWVAKRSLLAFLYFFAELVIVILFAAFIMYLLGLII